MIGNVSNKDIIRLRISYAENKDAQIFKALIKHPMETGYRRNHKTGEIIPADYIEDLQVSVDGEIYFETVWGENVSKNPYLSFTTTKPVMDNQRLKINWVDNLRREYFIELVVVFGKDGVFRFINEEKSPTVNQITHKVLPVCKSKISVSEH